MGWQTYGFGTIDRMINHGEYLSFGHAHAQMAQNELSFIANEMEFSVPTFQSLAILCFQLHSVLSHAHFHPADRQIFLDKALKLCTQFTPENLP
jgi:hypothetical protein